MKTCLLLISLNFFGYGLLAQNNQGNDNMPNDEFKTIFRKSDGHVKVSGFGGPMMSFGTIDGLFAHMMGGGGGVMVNNFFIGGYGMGLTTPIQYKMFADDGVTTYLSDDLNLSFGHGGFWTGVVIAPNAPIHLSISSQFGWGGIGQMSRGADDQESFNNKAIFVISPIVEAELNFSRFFKIGIGATTSLVQFINTDVPYDQGDFLNPNVFLSFKFGWFE